MIYIEEYERLFNEYLNKIYKTRNQFEGKAINKILILNLENTLKSIWLEYNKGYNIQFPYPYLAWITLNTYQLCLGPITKNITVEE